MGHGPQPRPPEFSDLDGALVVAPVGDVDLTNAEDLHKAILEASSNDVVGVIVDLSRTRYLDSAGIRVLFSVARRLEERRRRLTIVAPLASPLRHVLSIVQMETRAGVYPGHDEARAALVD